MGFVFKVVGFVLSTPSLGITRGGVARSGVAGPCDAFNSLSRDHRDHGAAPDRTETGGALSTPSLWITRT